MREGTKLRILLVYIRKLRRKGGERARRPERSAAACAQGLSVVCDLKLCFVAHAHAACARHPLVEELKRMVVEPAHRGRGVGQALLRAAEGLARGRGLAVMRLEVGIHNAAGEALYRREGYRDGPPFGGYRAMPISRFLAKSL